MVWSSALTSFFAGRLTLTMYGGLLIQESFGAQLGLELFERPRRFFGALVRDDVVVDVLPEFAPLFEVEEDGHLPPFRIGYELNAAHHHGTPPVLSLQPDDLGAAVAAQFARERVAGVHDELGEAADPRVVNAAVIRDDDAAVGLRQLFIRECDGL